MRAAGTARTQSLIASVAATLPPDQAEASAGIIASQLVGALQLARALGDNTKGRRHLARARQFLLDQFEASPTPNH